MYVKKIEEHRRFSIIPTWVFQTGSFEKRRMLLSENTESGEFVYSYRIYFEKKIQTNVYLKDMIQRKIILL